MLGKAYRFRLDLVNCSQVPQLVGEPGPKFELLFLRSQVGCRTKWDVWSDPDLVSTHSLDSQEIWTQSKVS